VNQEIKKIKRLFASLDSSSVRHCHWKSNQHLDEALSGKTDLDVLVDSAQAGVCRQLLREFGCKQVVPQPRAQYPGIEDWLAFDEESGRLAHIHLHFRIVIGNHPKNYRLSLENWLLSDCGSRDGLHIAAHEKELIVLLVRIAFKTRYLDLLQAWLLPQYVFLPHTIRAELDWLLERVHMKNIATNLSASGLPVDAGLLADFLDRYASGCLTPAYCLAFKVKITRSLKDFKIQSFAGVQIRRVKIFFKRFFLHAQTKKALCGRGVFFALVGADGSGKTRLAEDLLSWLSWKLETDVLYFGIPKSACAYQCIIKTIDLIERMKKKAYCLKVNLPGNMLGAVSGGFNSLLWLYIGYHRLALGRQAHASRDNGFVIIGERFPRSTFMNMTEPMDGPRLQKQSKSSVVSGLERFFYTRIEQPDHVFVLKAGVEVLHARKNSTPMISLREKADAVNRIEADGKTTVVDAEASYESVLRTIKRVVWDML